jgi:hypothetical protein
MALIDPRIAAMEVVCEAGDRCSNHSCRHSERHLPNTDCTWYCNTIKRTPVCVKHSGRNNN